MKSFVLSAMIAAASAVRANDSIPFRENANELYGSVEKYVSFGEHRTGTAADLATSAWLGGELKSFGFQVKFLEFPIRQFFPDKVFLTDGSSTVNAFPLWWVNEQISREADGRLVDVSSAKKLTPADIALIHFPLRGRKAGETESYLDSLAATGVKGVVVITDNPSGEIQEYNTSQNARPWKVPVILVAPKDSVAVSGFIRRARKVHLSIGGSFKDVKGRNVYGTIGHGDEYVVVSTPINGWFTCGGERGSGVAIWLSLARWAATCNRKNTLLCLPAIRVMSTLSPERINIWKRRLRLRQKPVYGFTWVQARRRSNG